MPHTIVYINGFDRAASRAEEFSGSEMAGNFSFSNNAWNYQPPYGGYGRFLISTQAGDRIHPQLPPSPSGARGVSFLFGLHQTTATPRIRFLEFFDSATASAALGLDLVFNPGTGRSHIQAMAGPAMVAEIQNALEPGANRWNSISVTAAPGLSGGVLRIAINGVLVLDFTGQTVQASGMQYDLVRLGQISVTGPATQIFLDNLAISNCDPSDPPLPEVRVVNGTSYSPVSVSWTPNTGTNQAAVSDDTPNGNTSFVSSDTAGAEDLYTASNWPALRGQVLAVKVSAVARKDDAGSQSLQNVVRIGGQSYAGSGKSLGSVYFRHWDVWNLNPATGQPWQLSEVGPALPFGFRNGN